MNVMSYFREADLSLDPRVFQQFQTLLELFKEKNNELNLSALKEDKDIIVKHFVDSLLPIHYFDFIKIKNLIDIGSGGGFPGIALGIYFPELEITVNDSVEKKMRAVGDFAKKLNLSNIHTLPGRVEDIGHTKKWRESFDCATLRAVALMPIALEYAAPLIKEKGYIVLYKGNTYKEELEQSKNAMKELHLKLESVHLAELPENMGERAILVFQKEQATPAKYPRAVGIAKKTPL